MELSPQDMGLSREQFPDWRPGQWDIIQRIANSDKRFILLQAPTGSGKSVLAWAVAKLRGETALVNTVKRSLQLQYMQLPDTNYLWGKQNERCFLWPSELSVDQAPCSLGAQCSAVHQCGYYVHRNEAVKSRVLVSNYYLTLFEANYSGRYTTGREWGICDEAHAIEDNIVSFVGIELDHERVSEYLQWNTGVDVPSWKRWAVAMLPVVNQLYKQQAADFSFTETGEYDALSEQQRREYRAFKRLRTLRDKVENLSKVDETWYIELGKERVTIKPVWGASHTQDTLFRHFKRGLLMSATLLRGQVTAQLLGIPQDQYEYIEAPMLFPRENRLVYYYNIARMGRKDRDKSIPKIIQAVDQIIDAFPQGKGLVHCHSYELAEKLYHASRHAGGRVFLQKPGGTGMIEAMQHLTNSKQPLVVLSPTMEEGVDMPDVLSFQIIPVMPWPSLKDQRVRKRMELSPIWYNYATAMALMQEVGRGVRNFTQVCPAYVLDSNFGHFYKDAQDLMPQTFKEAIVWHR